MKIYYIFFGLVLVLQIEILGLIILNGGNLRVWNSQAKFNDSVIQLITNQCMNK